MRIRTSNGDFGDPSDNHFTMGLNFTIYQILKKVDPRGLEPLTFPMPWGRATNYAMGPKKVLYSIKTIPNNLFSVIIFLVSEIINLI